jgi:hypothetical protein
MELENKARKSFIRVLKIEINLMGFMSVCCVLVAVLVVLVTGGTLVSISALQC